MIENDEEVVDEVVDLAQARRDHEAEQRALAYKHRTSCPINIQEAASELVGLLWAPKL